MLVLQNYSSVLGQRQTKGEAERRRKEQLFKEMMMLEERRFLSATTFSAMDPSSQIHWGPNRERQTGERTPQGEEKTSVWESKQANSERRTAGSRGAKCPCTQESERGSRGKKKRKAGVTNSWERREKSELDMGLCVAPLWFLLLICLSQAELLGKVWAAEQEGKNSSRLKQVFQMHSVIYICTFLQTDCQVYHLTWILVTNFWLDLRV